jgi:hypothetical protein
LKILVACVGAEGLVGTEEMADEVASVDEFDEL